MIREPRHQDWTDGIPVHTDVHRDDTITMSGVVYMRLRSRLLDAEAAVAVQGATPGPFLDRAGTLSSEPGGEAALNQALSGGRGTDG